MRVTHALHFILIKIVLPCQYHIKYDITVVMGKPRVAIACGMQTETTYILDARGVSALATGVLSTSCRALHFTR